MPPEPGARLARRVRRRARRGVPDEKARAGPWPRPRTGSLCRLPTSPRPLAARARPSGGAVRSCESRDSGPTSPRGLLKEHCSGADLERDLIESGDRARAVHARTLRGACANRRIAHATSLAMQARRATAGSRDGSRPAIERAPRARRPRSLTGWQRPPTNWHGSASRAREAREARGAISSRRASADALSAEEMSCAASHVVGLSARPAVAPTV